MDNPVLIFGANHLGQLAKDIFESNHHVVYGFLDDNKSLHGTELDDVAVLGSTDDDGFLKLIGKKCEAFVASDDTRLRKALVKMLIEKRKVQPVNAVHKLALISPRVVLGYGNLIDQGSVLSTGVQIGHYVVVHAGAIIGPGAVIGDHVQIGAGAVINAGVQIGEGAFIGSGAVLVAGVTIGKDARVGAGSVVIGNVAEGETVFGNPAKTVKT
ncbi:MAG: NeuD/PglB/VioB family sugar acetyltransferase [Cyclobacteriaceae bacterium]|nr:NeuD/PglB/VioB family sugar acetyltransferase [Cyclobacteriaceae bacterium]MCX7638280.1 NeuD/PglB/VioB family sugar acetyltransferase [Cyclobacteriaceae bacterium]MDW8332284.1 NeuD/PglB/VioB family sugar acetyltransferase [Cyclobacteriaceae bacterium]